jgi:RNA polymerase sigma factor (sigma-70 family)
MTVDNKTRQELLKADWELARAKALKRAVHEASIFRVMGLAPPDPEDLVHEACIKVLSGERNWDQERYPDLGTHLSWIIGSIASHERERLCGHRPVSLNQKESASFQVVDSEIASSPHAPAIPNPEELAIQREQWRQVDNRLSEISKEDEEIGLVLLCFQDGIVKPGEIASVLEWDTNRVNNALKRIRRRLQQ